MLGKYSTKVVLPKTKSELVRKINALGDVEIKVVEPLEDRVRLVRSEIDRFVIKGKKISVVLIRSG